MSNRPQNDSLVPEILSSHLLEGNLDLVDSLDLEAQHGGCSLNPDHAILIFGTELKPRGYYLEHVFYMDHDFTNMTHVLFTIWINSFSLQCPLDIATGLRQGGRGRYRQRGRYIKGL